MNHPLMNVLDNVDRPYYFGIGGIGDFLLLMSTFYDGVQDGEVDVVFVANSVKPLQQLASSPKPNDQQPRDYFPKVNRFWFFPRSAFPYSVEMWEYMQNDERLRGTGVTPKAFQYIQDWNECGKSNVFEYYGVMRPLYPFRRVPLRKPLGNSIRPVVIQPFGGSDDTTKVKQLSKVLLRQLVNKRFRTKPIVFIGSPSDMAAMKDMDWSPRDERVPIRYCVDIKEAVNYIRLCSLFIGADSWGKTAAALSGMKPSFIEVYKNKYINKTPQEMFGQDTDPGDYVFLHNWGFKLLDDPEVL